VVIIVQENRSTDNLFGSNPNFEPGVDIATFGMNSRDEKVPLTPIPLVNCYDLNHRHIAFVTQYNKGKMNGSDKNTTNPFEGCKVPPNPQYKYVDNSHGEIQPYFDMATQYGWANRMFQTNQGPSFTAHQFIISGTSAPTADSPMFAEGNPKLTDLAGCIAPPEQTVDVLDPEGDDAPPIYPCFEHSTLTDVLNDAHVSWKYYAASAGFIWTGPNAINHMCVPKMQGGKLVCTGPDWVNNVVIGQRRVLDDIKSCDLANVVWVTPSGLQSDHPKVNDGSGPTWVSSIVNAIGNNTACANGEVYWRDTAILITWDDWGGWYDHVPPFRIGQPNGWGKADTYGFRVPLLVVSAYTPAGYVDNSVLDFGSTLKFIEVNFGAPGKPLGPIPPGTYADAYAENNLRNFFTLTSPRPFQTITVKFNAKLFLKDTSRWLFEEISRCGASCWF
jgi:phospholipase C